MEKKGYWLRRDKRSMLSFFFFLRIDKSQFLYAQQGIQGIMAAHRCFYAFQIFLVLLKDTPSKAYSMIFVFYAFCGPYLLGLFLTSKTSKREEIREVCEAWQDTGIFSSKVGIPSETKDTSTYPMRRRDTGFARSMRSFYPSFAQDTKLRKIVSFCMLSKGYRLSKIEDFKSIGYWYLFFEGLRVVIFSFVCSACILSEEIIFSSKG